MHAISQSLAHRGPGATRSRARWQPYAAQLSSSARSTPHTQPQQFLNTPASCVTVSPSSPITTKPISSLCDPRNPPQQPQPRDVHAQLREIHRARLVNGLVDQAVKSLSDIWPEDDIPAVFKTSGHARAADAPSTPAAADPSLRPRNLNMQLPSPISPHTRSPAYQPHVAPPNPPSASATPTPVGTGSSTAPLVPLRQFVLEVLRRSKTSATVLQTALCYIAAVRPKIPELVAREKAGLGDADAMPMEERITVEIPTDNEQINADDVNKAQKTAISDDGKTECYVPQLQMCTPRSEGCDTVRIADDERPAGPARAASFGAEPFTLAKPSNVDAFSTSPTFASQTTLPPLPPLPSTLLCPRRTFLAALILASKFALDRTYSNKAWARLAGLPPREIGRCERALGSALEWRLWVGKLPGGVNASVLGKRAVGRCRSESDLFARAGRDNAVPSVTEAIDSGALAPPNPNVCSLPNIGRSLGRAATLPSLSLPSVPEGCVARLDQSSYSSTSMYAQAFWPAATSAAPPLYSNGFRSAASTPMDTSSPSTAFTPPLTLSPTSTISSSGSAGDDPTRTIQMSSFSDVESPMAPYAYPGPKTYPYQHGGALARTYEQDASPMSVAAGESPYYGFPLGAVPHWHTTTTGVAKQQNQTNQVAIYHLYQQQASGGRIYGTVDRQGSS
ncbi:hypothetical protein PUNSTDRAFT_111874 [Punctularia strigosozonata HHB-11173 SS5]|uniref:uncharacterized protein n=1 Tax=Punctularia strigosozonata (strain HHB-11173) TaxID=741275 RepID=UPI0004418656|nr:uncharacterized protein PUNSTDRAFT_111874 [Punctularia strigosozonata HHB-11173 SS5]EIN11846.1 hypothetical protein PUNSTDRAFT_111874 [Punctularia strigosozonata HHB-11173 SS5]